MLRISAGVSATLIRNLGRGFSDLTAGIAARLRVSTAWIVLTVAL